MRSEVIETAFNKRKKHEAERKANERISASEARFIAADVMGADLSEVTVTDNGTYYSAAIHRRIDGEIYESACKVDEKTGNVYDRVG